MECNPIIDVSSVRDARIYLGVFTTFHARSQTFDLSAWQNRLGVGTFTVNLLRPGDTVPYAVAGVTIDGAAATWTFDATDTAFSGYGKVFLSYAGEDFLEKTVDIPVYIAENCGPAGDTPPDPLANWYDRMLETAAQAQTAAEAAEADSASASDSAARAADAADAAQAAAQGVENMTATAHGILGDEPTVDKTVSEGGVVNLDFGIPIGEPSVDYNDLVNKPQINGVTLDGDKTGAELGLDRTYVHTQGAAAAEWTIAHGLGKYPSVTAVDSTGRVVLGEVRYQDENTVVLTFAGAFSGVAYLN